MDLSEEREVTSKRRENLAIAVRAGGGRCEEGTDEWRKEVHNYKCPAFRTAVHETRAHGSYTLREGSYKVQTWKAMQ